MMKEKDGWKISWKTLKFPVIFLAIFSGIAIWRYSATG